MSWGVTSDEFPLITSIFTILNFVSCPKLIRIYWFHQIGRDLEKRLGWFKFLLLILFIYSMIPMLYPVFQRIELEIYSNKQLYRNADLITSFGYFQKCIYILLEFKQNVDYLCILSSALKLFQIHFLPNEPIRHFSIFYMSTIELRSKYLLWLELLFMSYLIDSHIFYFLGLAIGTVAIVLAKCKYYYLFFYI